MRSYLLFLVFLLFSCFYILLFAFVIVNCFLPVQEYLMEGTMPDEKWAVWTELVQVLRITKIILLIATMKRVRAYTRVDKKCDLFFTL